MEDTLAKGFNQKMAIQLTSNEAVKQAVISRDRYFKMPRYWFKKRIR
jgi:hypothetical protein